VNLVSLTAAGHTLLGDLTTTAHEHDAAITAALTATQRNQLRTHLAAIAETLGLSPGVHPGCATTHEAVRHRHISDEQRRSNEVERSPHSGGSGGA
jgi:hypothetical protein